MVRSAASRRPGSRSWNGAGIAGAILVLTVAGAAARPDAGPDSIPEFPRAGSLPPDFTLPVLTDTAPWVSDEKATLSDFDDRWVYLDVFGSWCPPCRRKQPKMVEIAGILEERGAVVVGMLLKDRPEDAATWLHANGGMAYPYVVLDAETERAWGITGAPMGFLISPEGRLERLCYGCADGPDGVESLVEAVSGPYPGRRSVR